MFQNIFFLTIADLVKELAEEASSYVAFSLAVDESTDNVISVFTGVCVHTAKCLLKSKPLISWLYVLCKAVCSHLFL